MGQTNHRLSGVIQAILLIKRILSYLKGSCFRIVGIYLTMHIVPDAIFQNLSKGGIKTKTIEHGLESGMCEIDMQLKYFTNPKPFFCRQS